MDQNHYEVLGVAQNATPKEIKAAYRLRMKEAHTDSVLAKKAELEKKGVGAELIEELVRPILEKREEESKRINLAYEVLSDSKKRTKYDGELKTQAPPILEIKPQSINLGKLAKGTVKEVGFQIINNGGELTENIEISGWENLEWVDEKRIELDEEGIFPITVSFVVNTTHFSGSKNLSLTVKTEGSSATFVLTVTCAEQPDAKDLHSPSNMRATSRSLILSSSKVSFRRDWHLLVLVFLAIIPMLLNLHANTPILPGYRSISVVGWISAVFLHTLICLTFAFAARWLYKHYPHQIVIYSIMLTIGLAMYYFALVPFPSHEAVMRLYIWLLPSIFLNILMVRSLGTLAIVINTMAIVGIGILVLSIGVSEHIIWAVAWIFTLLRK